MSQRDKFILQASDEKSDGIRPIGQWIDVAIYPQLFLAQEDKPIFAAMNRFEGYTWRVVKLETLP